MVVDERNFERRNSAGCNSAGPNSAGLNSGSQRAGELRWGERGMRRRAVGLVLTAATALAPLTNAHAAPPSTAPELATQPSPSQPSPSQPSPSAPPPSAPPPSAPPPSAPPPPSHATASASAEQRSDAQRAREQGELHFDAGRYPQAAAAFARAFELTRTARDRFNQGTALHWAGDCTGAREAFEAYLTLDDDEPLERAERRSDANTALEFLDRQCPQATPEHAAPAAASAAAGLPVPGSTGPVSTGVAADGAGSLSPAVGPLPQPTPLQSVTAANAPAALSPPAGVTPESDAGSTLPVLRWSALGTGAALAIAAVATGFAGHAAAIDLEDLNRDAAAHGARWDDCCLERARDLNGERRSYKTATTVLGVASGMLLGTAAVLWTLDLDTESASGAGIGSATLSYRSRF
jgi:hypothetical protein